MCWNAEELLMGLSLAKEIERHRCPRHSIAEHRSIELRHADAIPLLADLSCYRRGLICRHISNLFGFDRPPALRWRMEHKLIQSLLLKHYISQGVPSTTGLERNVGTVSDISVMEQQVHAAMEKWHLKAALGHGSGETGKIWSVGEVLNCFPPDLGFPLDLDQLEEEMFVLQEKLNICREYRVHTVEDRVVPGATCARYSRDPVSTLSERIAAESFIRCVLESLPNALVYQAFYGWDVAQTADGSFHVIEANIAGFHSVFKPGFHFSGFFMGRSTGPIFVARLLHFLEIVYDVTITVVADGLLSDDSAVPYLRTAEWKKWLYETPHRPTDLPFPRRFAAEYGSSDR